MSEIAPEPTRLDRATGREAEVLRAAVNQSCPECGAAPGDWCFRAAGEWTMHAERILGGYR